MMRLSSIFDQLAAGRRPGFIAYVMAGDPDPEPTLSLLHGLAEAGADVIELGLPFNDPMADGPVIQAAALRALEGGMTVRGALALVSRFRERNDQTPIVLMGYANPLHAYGYPHFSEDAAAAGADGVICVDLPPEEDADLRAALSAAGLALIRLATPTTKPERLTRLVQDASGFIYYVSTTGVTGAGSGRAQAVAEAVARVRAASNLPVAVGFGVKTPARAAEIAQSADAVVVGSALIEALQEGGAEAALALARDLAAAIHGARQAA